MGACSNREALNMEFTSECSYYQLTNLDSNVETPLPLPPHEQHEPNTWNSNAVAKSVDCLPNGASNPTTSPEPRARNILDNKRGRMATQAEVSQIKIVLGCLPLINESALLFERPTKRSNILFASRRLWTYL